MPQAECMKLNVIGALRGLEAHGTGSWCYRLFVYGSPDGKEPTLNDVKSHLNALLDAGFVSLSLDDPLLWEGVR